MDRDTSFAVATAKVQNAKVWQQGTVTWGELIEWTKNPADHRECGNYLLGTLEGKHRTRTSIVSRSALVLDADHTTASLIDRFELVFPYALLAHTTYHHAPDEPRYRFIIPLDREVAPDEYHAVATAVMQLIGEDQFDPTCAQPARYMFKPSAQNATWYQRWEYDGAPLPVDDFLADFELDLATKELPKPSRSKRDPFEIEGVIGAFNRAYEDIQLLIDQYELPYQPSHDDRWQLTGAKAAAGMGQVTRGLVYSHHANDPAAGRACSAFDLVRLHRYGELDEGKPDKTPINRLPSHTAMLELASTDHRVVAELVGADFSEELEAVIGDNGWKTELRRNPRTGTMLDVIENWDIIRQHDPLFAGLVYNELSLAVETTQDLPWRPLTRGGSVFGSVDRAALCHYLEREFKLRPLRSLVDELVQTTAQQRFINPVRDYLDELVWDGVPRLETCLPGVRPTDYTRMVARKSLVAAVARMYEPGIKWDHTVVLFGPEGKGKSYWVDRMARGFSASLGRIGDKDTLITMQRSWIMLADEGYSLKKADADVQKEFLTRTEDVFRMPYEREAMAHKRHCVIWSSTNDEVFLRRQEGNRRFLIVHCQDRVDFTALTDDYIGQVWAEAVHHYRAGEVLFLSDTESNVAALEREQFTEEDALAGVIEEYLSRLVPEDWEEMSPEARTLWMQNRSDGLVKEGTHPIERVCSVQLWVEALGNAFGRHQRRDLLEINAALKRIPGWTSMPGRHRLPHYGPQLVFTRTSSTADILSELI